VIALKARVGWDESAGALIVEAPSEADAILAFLIMGQTLAQARALNAGACALWEQLRKELVDLTRWPQTIVVRLDQKGPKS
jgi:hypothetical protein